MTIDIDMKATVFLSLRTTNSNTDTVPLHDGPKGEKIIIFGKEIYTSKYFPLDPLLLIFSDEIFKVLSTTLEHRTLALRLGLNAFECASI